MSYKLNTIAKLIVMIIGMVAFFQLIWPYVYNIFASIKTNPNPSAEYLNSMAWFSPNGLTIMIVVIGGLAIAYVAIFGSDDIRNGGDF